MNKIWVIIIFFSIIFGLLLGNGTQMVEALFLVFEKVLYSLVRIGSMLVIYNGLFKIAIESNIIKKISKLLIKLVRKLFKTRDEELLEWICASITCNLLGLGPANMSIAIKIVERLGQKKYVTFDLGLYLLINISSLCILPLSTLTLRNTYKGMINIEFVLLLFITSFLTTLFAVFLFYIFGNKITDPQLLLEKGIINE